MGISLKGELGEIHTNQPLVLLMRLQNTSSNDVFSIRYAKQKPEGIGLYSFHVTSPSGSAMLLDTTQRSYEGSVKLLPPGESMQLSYELTRLCQLQEVGTYTIIAKRLLSWFSRNKGRAVSAELVSNFVIVPVVVAGGNTNAELKIGYSRKLVANWRQAGGCF